MEKRGRSKSNRDRAQEWFVYLTRAAGSCLAATLLAVCATGCASTGGYSVNWGCNTANVVTITGKTTDAAGLQDGGGASRPDDKTGAAAPPGASGSSASAPDVDIPGFLEEWVTWLGEGSNRIRIVAEAPELLIYDPKHDYCGPENGGILRWLVPNRIYGAGGDPYKIPSVNMSAFWHDRLYQIGGGAAERKRADRAFYLCLLDAVDNALTGPMRYPARGRCYLYYLAVRAGGRFTFYYTDEVYKTVAQK